MVSNSAKRAITKLLMACLVLSLLITAVPSKPALAAVTTYQAESATLSQAVVATNHTGFTGTGFVDYNNVAGSYVEFTVNAPAAGSATLIFRYSNGTTTNRPMDISVNGTVVSTNLAFNGTTNWDTWANQSLAASLNAGTNTIRATATTINGGPNVDKLDVDISSTPPPSEVQAETCVLSQAVVATNQAGFTGTGFVDYNNVAGSYVECTVSATAASSTTLTFRFANGSTANRPMSISVNGAVVNGSLAFNPTGAWTTWANQSLTVALNAGSNTIRATANAAEGGPNLDRLNIGDAPQPGTDWGKAMVDSTMRRFTPSTIGGWSYPVALYMMGQYQIYKRTGNRAYFDYIKAWVDRFVASDGTINNSFNNLDSMLGGNVLIIMFQETGQSKYRIAAAKIRNRFNTYPRTTDGGFWHANTESRAWQLWADGVFMSMPFLARYGQTIGDSTYAYDEATKQLVVYFSHLKRSNGLLWHAYDEKKVQSWANPTTGTSPESWCRAIGWFAMATVDILEIIPADHPRRAALVDIVRHLAVGFERYQDPVSGRWFQVVDKGSQAGNWTETSCSSMYTYMLSRGVERGYIDAQYQTVAQKGYQGVLGRISLDGSGLTNLRIISEGTNVGNYDYYIARAQRTNDFHGLGAFLLMYEQLNK